MKNILKYTCLAGILIFSSSCERDLDLLPLDQLTSDVFFKQTNDFRLFANDLYNQLPSFGRSSRDNWSDLHFTGGGNEISNSTYIESDNSTTWNNAYRNIRNCLVLIEKEAELEPGNTKDEVQVFKGEAHFFLAMNYFNLLKVYGGVPLINSTLDLDDERIFGPRATREQIVDYIMENLDAAIAAPVGTLTDAADEGRLTMGAVRSFKARVALFEGTWRKYHGLGNENEMLDIAIDESRTVINSGQYSLFKNTALGDQSYFYFFILESDVQSNPIGLGKEAQNEYILTRKHNKLDAPTGYISTNSGNLSPTLKLANMYLDNTGLPIDHPSSVFQGHGFTIDPVTYIATNTEYIDRDPRMLNNMIEPFHQFWYHSPYQRDYSLTNLTGTGGWNEGYWTSATGYLNSKFLPEVEGNVGIDFPVIRLAEVMLIFAESSFERNGVITDAELDMSINMLRDRVEMPHLTNTFVSANNLDMLTEIRRERAVELVNEGFRYDDLRRWKTAETEMSEALKGIQFANSPISTPGGYDVFSVQTNQIETVLAHINKAFPLDVNGFSIMEEASNRNFEQKHYLWPLPLRQIALNPALEQNPGWNSQ
ncbi:RagB/SusD family nutrient uptake outer membrane protein [Fulvivirgaceae bacterium BMA10]|uniref:RagB/SusD family nutrient uptake outer membrane protein n=1 Tax=Splendidivirga corallicola TaxID=3051826 RepID=A0ABT8KUA6_9BACT|nr:RagB/SusD family nutrient uptake outer membrane protein [Fulvivirgaceae bacterium BMA10]